MGAAIMGTGIVSVALLLDAHTALSEVLLWIALAVTAAFAAQGLRLAATPAGRQRLRAAARRPDALTAIAGPAVVGTRLLIGGHTWPAIVVLAASIPAWAVLTPAVLRALPARVGGGAFLLAVATQSPAVVAATLADATGTGWLAWVALGFALAGLALYVLVLLRFDLRSLAHGGGEHWVSGGALAISTLAVADVVRAQDGPDGAHGVVRVLVLAVWIAAMLWLAPLVVAELRWRRPAPDARRWSTIFPLGMYAAMSFAVGGVTGWAVATDFARIETWVAAAAWAALAVAGAARAVRRRGPTSPT